MGGFGSGGRNTTGAATCESRLRIDLAWLRRRGHAQAGLAIRSLTWSLSGEQTGSITLIAQQDGVRLTLPDKRSRRVTGRRQRARPLRLHAHQVRRPPAMAPLPEMRQGLPEDLWRALFPVPAVLPPAIRLAERKAGSARLGPSSQDCQAPARQVGRSSVKYAQAIGRV